MANVFVLYNYTNTKMYSIYNIYKIKKNTISIGGTNYHKFIYLLYVVLYIYLSFSRHFIQTKFTSPAKADSFTLIEECRHLKNVNSTTIIKLFDSSV